MPRSRSPYNEGNLVLYNAIKNGNEAIAKNLLEEATNIDVKIYKDNSALYEAIKHIHRYSGLELLSFLIEKGACINLQNTQGKTCLYKAVNKGSRKIVKFLIKIQGIDLNIPTEYGESPVALAARKIQNPNATSRRGRSCVRDRTADKEMNKLIRKKYFLCLGELIWAGAETQSITLHPKMSEHESLQCRHIVNKIKTLKEGINELQNEAQKGTLFKNASPLPREILDMFFTPKLIFEDAIEQMVETYFDWLPKNENANIERVFRFSI